MDALLHDPEHWVTLGQEVRRVAEEIAADPNYAEEEPIGPDANARERFRAFAKRQLGSP